MAGFEEVARVSAVIDANLAPFERALGRGEARTKAFAASTKVGMEAAETAVERSAAAMARAAERGAALQGAAGAKASAGMKAQAASATAMGAQIAQSYAKASSSVLAASNAMVSANARAAKAATSQASAARVASASVVKSQQAQAVAAEQSATRVQAASTRATASMSGVAARGAAFARSMGTALGLVGGYGVAAATAGILKTGATFDQTMSGVRAATGATQAEFEALRGAAIALGADTAFSAVEVGASMVELGKAGYNAQRSLKAIPGVLDAAAASGEDMATVTTIVVETINALGMAAEQSTEVADALAWSANATTSSIGDMGEAMKYVAPVGEKMGAGLHTINAALAILAENGIKGSMAGTSLAGTMQSMMAPNRRVEKMLKQTGVTFRDAAGNVRPLAQNLEMLRKVTDRMGKEEADKFLARTFGRENLKAILSLLSAGSDGLRKYEMASRSAKGEAAEFASVLRDNLAGDLEELGGAVESASIRVSDLFRDDLRSQVGRFKVYIDSEDFERDAKAVVGTVIAVGKAFAGTAEFVYQHKDAIVVLTGAYLALRAAAAAAATAQSIAGVASLARGGRAAQGVGAVAGAAQVGAVGAQAAGAATKMASFAKYAGLAARGLTGIGLATIGLQLLLEYGRASKSTGDDVKGLAGDVDGLVGELDRAREAHARTADEVNSKRLRKGSSGRGSGSVDRAEEERALEKSRAAAARAEEETAERLARIEDKRAQKAKERQEALGEYVRLQTIAADAQQRIDDGEASPTDRRRRNNALDGAEEAIAAYRRLGGEIDSLEGSAGRLKRALGQAGTSFKGPIEDLPDAFRKGEVAADRVAFAIKRMGRTPLNMRIARELVAEMTAAERKATFGTADINAILARVGKTPASRQWANAFANDLAAARREASKPVVVQVQYRRTTVGEIPSFSPTNALRPAVGATGGKVKGPGTGTSDDVPAWLSNGEYVVKARSVDKYGVAFLDALNAGEVPAYASGGYVAGPRGNPRPHRNRGESKDSWDKRFGAWQNRVRQYDSFASDQWRKKTDYWSLEEARLERGLALAERSGSKPRQIAALRNLAAMYDRQRTNPLGKHGLQAFKSSNAYKWFDAGERASVEQAIVGALRNFQTVNERIRALGGRDVQGRTDADLAGAVSPLEALQQRYAQRFAQLDAQLAAAERTSGFADDQQAIAALRSAYGEQEGELRGLLPRLSGQDVTTANQLLASAIRSGTDLERRGVDAGLRDEQLQAQLAQAQRQRDVEADRARLSENALGVFAGANDVGYGGGRNTFAAASGARGGVVVNVNAMSGYDPAVRQAIADAADGGFSQGANANRIYTGRG